MRNIHSAFRHAAFAMTAALLLVACGSPPALPPNAAVVTAVRSFTQWATDNGEPYRDVQITESDNDGVFAEMYVTA